MPGLYAGKDYDLAGFAVGAVERDALLPRTDIEAGDIVFGLRSSGLHSNGFSLVRQIVADAGLGVERSGAFRTGHFACRSAARPDSHLRRPDPRGAEATDAIKALAHITGGGFPDNLPRVLPAGLGVALDLAAIPVPAVFRWLAATGNVAAAEMLRTFNCGIGMVVVAAKSRADEVLAALRSAGETPVQLGEIVARDAQAPRPHVRAARPVIARKRTAILISGRGSNMQALVQGARAPEFPAEIALVLSNRPEAQGSGFRQRTGTCDCRRRSQNPCRP